MGLSDWISYITPETAVGIAIVMTVGVYAFWKELIFPGPRYRALEKRLARAERRERTWQRLYILAVTAGKAAGLSEMDLDLEMEEAE